jgi:small redox-active disulfide protein 2
MPIEEKKMEIKVLGPGCKKCHETEKIVKAALAEASVDATVEYVTDIKEIARYGVFVTPAVVVNGGVKSVGKVPKKDDVLAWLTGK